MWVSLFKLGTPKETLLKLAEEWLEQRQYEILAWASLWTKVADNKPPSLSFLSYACEWLEYWPSSKHKKRFDVWAKAFELSAEHTVVREQLRPIAVAWLESSWGDIPRHLRESIRSCSQR